MNLEKTINLLGSLQTLLSVLTQLPEAHREFVARTLRNNGVDAHQLARDVVKTKHSLQDLPLQGFEALVSVSTDHLLPEIREALLLADDKTRLCWHLPVYVSGYGAFIRIVKESPPSEHAPACLQEIYAWAVELGLCWVRLDRCAALVNELPVYVDRTLEHPEEALAYAI